MEKELNIKQILINIDEYFNNVKPEHIIKILEKLGCEFIDIKDNKK